MARTPTIYDPRLLQDAQTTLRESVAAINRGDVAIDIEMLRTQAKRVLRAQLYRLKRGIVAARGGSAIIFAIQSRRRNAPDEVRAPFVTMTEERRRLIEGGEDAILVEYGLTAETIREASIAQERRAKLENANCDACGEKLVSFDPEEHAMEREQLGCTSCGAMFEPELFSCAPRGISR